MLFFLPRENIRSANMYMDECLSPGIIREMRIKTKRFYLTPVGGDFIPPLSEWLLPKEWTVASIGKLMENKKP